MPKPPPLPYDCLLHEDYTGRGCVLRRQTPSSSPPTMVTITDAGILIDRIRSPLKYEKSMCNDGQALRRWMCSQVAWLVALGHDDTVEACDLLSSLSSKAR